MYQSRISVVQLTSSVATTPSTSSPIGMPASDFSFQVTAKTTGTSVVVATCVWQGSNDNATWFPVATAVTSATQASTGAVVASAGAAVTATARTAYGRSVVTLTGTGNASTFLAA